MRVLLLTRYGRLGASSRVRSLQFLPYLEAHGIKCTVSPLLGDGYVQSIYSGHISPMEVTGGYCRRISALVRHAKYDLVWLEKEALPWLRADHSSREDGAG